MSKCIIVGDPHIGKNLSQGKVCVGSTINSRLADQLNLLDFVFDRSIEHQAENIIILGDVWEECIPKPYLITHFITWLKKCEQNGIHVHIIRGNHDILRSGNVYISPLDIITEAELPLTTIYKDFDTITIDTTSFVIMPFRDRKSFGLTSNAEAILLLRNSIVYELASIPKTYHKICCGHYAIVGSIPIGDEFDDLTNELFTPLDMFNGFDYVWFGHIHRPQVMQKSDPYIAHIGSLDISNFGETEQSKHIIIFDCVDGSFIEEKLPTRPLQKISIYIPKYTENTTEYVIEQIKKNGVKNNGIIRVEIDLEATELKSINKHIIDKYLMSNGAFSINGIIENKKLTQIKKSENEEITNEMEVSSAIKTYAQTYVDEKIRSDFISGALEIYEQYKMESKESITHG